MNRLKRIGSGILGGTAVVVGAVAGYGLGALQTAAEDLVVAFIDNMF